MNFDESDDTMQLNSARLKGNNSTIKVPKNDLMKSQNQGKVNNMSNFSNNNPNDS